MRLTRDGWIISYYGSVESGIPNGRVWFPDDKYDEAVDETQARRAKWGHDNVMMSPHYVTK